LAQALLARVAILHIHKICAAFRSPQSQKSYTAFVLVMIRVIVLASMCVRALGTERNAVASTGNAMASTKNVTASTAQQTTPSPADQAAMLACTKACPKLLDIKVEDCGTVKEGSLCMQGEPQCSSWKLMDSQIAEALKKCDADGSTTAAAARPSAVATSSATKVTSVLALTTATATLFA